MSSFGNCFESFFQNSIKSFFENSSSSFFFFFWRFLQQFLEKIFRKLSWRFIETTSRSFTGNSSGNSSSSSIGNSTRIFLEFLQKTQRKLLYQINREFPPKRSFVSSSGSSFGNLSRSSINNPSGRTIENFSSSLIKILPAQEFYRRFLREINIDIKIEFPPRISSLFFPEAPLANPQVVPLTILAKVLLTIPLKNSLRALPGVPSTKNNGKKIFSKLSIGFLQEALERNFKDVILWIPEWVLIISLWILEDIYGGIFGNNSRENLKRASSTRIPF